MNIFKQSLVLQGFPVNEAIKHLSNSKILPFDEYVSKREKLRWDIFYYHLHNNKAYYEWLKNQYFTRGDSWSDIPILTKKDIQKPISERLSNGFNEKNIYIHNTSGSSGQPFFFAKDKFCHAMTWAVILDRYSQHGIIYGNSLQARFYGIPLSKNRYWKEKIKDTIACRVRFTVFDLSDKILEGFLKRFSQISFEYINGYTSSLVVFAKFLIKKNIVLKSICPTLKVAIPTSEMLNNFDKNILEKGFGIPIINEYGAAELDIIAFEDKDYDWILNDDNLWIEIVDENDNLVQPGKEGRIIITSFFNKAMPFIRYDLGDIGSIAEEKKGNYQILKTLQGRTNDIAILPSGKKSPGLTFYYISKSLLESGGTMKEFIIKQIAADHFVFEYVSETEISSIQKQKVYEAMDAYLEHGLKADFIKKEKLERTKAGKLKQFQSLVK